METGTKGLKHNMNIVINKALNKGQSHIQLSKPLALNSGLLPS